MKKKLFSLLLVLVLSLTLVACKKEPKPEPIDPNEEKILEVYNSLDGLISKPESISSDLTLPAKFLNGVTGEWKSSNEDLLEILEPSGTTVKGKVTRPAFEEGDKKVTLSIVLKLEVEGSEAITKEWKKELTILKLDKIEIEESYTSLQTVYDDVISGKLAIGDGFKTSLIKIDNVTLFSNTTSGYHLATADGTIAFVNGKANMPEKGKLFNITAKVNDYHGYLQLADVNYTEVEGTITHKATYKETTIDKINEMPIQNVDGHKDYSRTFKLKDVKLYVDPTIKDERYNLVLISKDLDPATADRNKDGDYITNSIMIYYPTNDFAAVKLLAGLEISEVNVIFEGYRSDKFVKFVSIQSVEDVTLAAELTDQESVDAAKSALNVETEFVKAGTINLLTDGALGTSIEWSFKDETDVNNKYIDLATGAVTMPEGDQVNVKIVATISKGDVSETKEFTIIIGELKLKTISDALALDKNRKIKISGVITGKFAKQTYGFQDATGASIALYTKEELVVGREYVLSGTKDEYNGLHQLKDIKTESVKLGEIPVAKDITSLLGNTEELKKYIAGVVEVKGLEVTKVEETKKSDVVTGYQVSTKLGGNTIAIRYSNETNSVSKPKANALEGLVVGDIIDYVGHLNWFKDAQLGFGSQSSVTVQGAEVAPITSLGLFDFAKLSGKKGTEIKDSEEFLTMMNSTTDQKDILVAVENLSRIYQGNGTGGGRYENSEKVLKTGTGSVDGTMRFVFSKNIKQIKITGVAWGEDTVTINGVTVKLDKNNADVAAKTYTIDLTSASNVLDFFFSKRIIIEKIEFLG